jgi:hypothetical protein
MGAGVFSQLLIGWGLVAISAAAVATAAAAAAPATAEAAASATTTATTTAASTAASTAVSATAASSAARTILAGTGLVDGEGPAAVLLAVQGRDGGLGFFIGSHLDETESLAAPGVAIVDDLRRDDRAVRTKQLFQLGAIDLIAQVADVQLLTHCRSPGWED